MKNTELRGKKKLLQKTPLATKKPIAKKPKQHTISWYKREADRVYSLAVRYRFAEANRRAFGEFFVECITCGVEKPLKQMQCGHFMSRQYNSTRYCDQNTAPQCYGCNVMHQGRQYEFGMALDDLYGPHTAKKMHDLAKVPHTWKRDELIKIIQDAKDEVASYDGGFR